MTDERKPNGDEEGRDVTAEERRLEQLLSQMPARLCPPRVRENVIARLREGEPSEAGPRESPRPKVVTLWFRRRARVLLQAAAILAFAVVGTKVYFEVKPKLRSERVPPAPAPKPPSPVLAVPQAGSESEVEASEPSKGVAETARPASKTGFRNGRTVEESTEARGILREGDADEKDESYLGLDLLESSIHEDGEAGGLKPTPAPKPESVRVEVSRQPVPAEPPNAEPGMPKAPGAEAGRPKDSQIRSGTDSSAILQDAFYKRKDEIVGGRDRVFAEGERRDKGAQTADEAKRSDVELEKPAGEPKSPEDRKVARRLPAEQVQARADLPAVIEVNGQAVQNAERYEPATQENSKKAAETHGVKVALQETVRDEYLEDSSAPPAAPTLGERVMKITPANLAWLEVEATDEERMRDATRNTIQEIKFTAVGNDLFRFGDELTTWHLFANNGTAGVNDIVLNYDGIVNDAREVVLDPGQRQALLVEADVPLDNTGDLVNTVNRKRMMAVVQAGTETQDRRGQATASVRQQVEGLANQSTAAPATRTRRGGQAPAKALGLNIEKVEEGELAGKPLNAFTNFFIQTAPGVYALPIAAAGRAGGLQATHIYLDANATSPAADGGAGGFGGFGWQRGLDATSTVLALGAYFSTASREIDVLQKQASGVRERPKSNSRYLSYSLPGQTSQTMRLYFVIEPDPLPIEVPAKALLETKR